MDDESIEISEYTGAGYKPLIYFGAWRVAILNWIDEIQPERIDYLERHTLTDEVFVLLKGQATLYVGGCKPEVVGIKTERMEPGKMYNVKQNAWHTVVMSQEASILIVEDADTGETNSEYWKLTEEQRRMIREYASSEGK